MQAFAVGEKAVPSSAMAEMVAELGERDPLFVVTNADGNEASNMKVINERAEDPPPHRGRALQPVAERPGLRAAERGRLRRLAAGSRCSAGARCGCPTRASPSTAGPSCRPSARPWRSCAATPAVVSMFTAGALEQGRNGWTHQRPEIENYIGGQMRNGNVYLLYPATPT
jgi:hypothetical protein